ncbi:hypothetical protein JZ751_028913, partial [Albula glossodonta]
MGGPYSRACQLLTQGSRVTCCGFTLGPLISEKKRFGAARCGLACSTMQCYIWLLVCLFVSSLGRQHIEGEETESEKFSDSFSALSKSLLPDPTLCPTPPLPPTTPTRSQIFPAYGRIREHAPMSALHTCLTCPPPPPPPIEPITWGTCPPRTPPKDGPHSGYFREQGLGISLQKYDIRAGSAARGDAVAPLGPQRPGTVGRGDVFLVEEDTDLADPSLQRPPISSGPNKRPRPKGGREGGKPGSASKALDENITIDKSKATGGAFPGKPVDDVINLDSASSSNGLKKKTPPVPSRPRPDHPNSNRLREEELPPSTMPTLRPAPTPSSRPKSEVVMVTTRPSTSDPPTRRGHGARNGTSSPVGGANSGPVKVTPKDGDIVQGLDGKMYRVVRGPQGLMGPLGKPGCPGKRGYAGFKGDKGATGPQGRDGRMGDPGPPGPPGMPTLYLSLSAGQFLQHPPATPSLLDPTLSSIDRGLDAPLLCGCLCPGWVQRSWAPSQALPSTGRGRSPRPAPLNLARTSFFQLLQAGWPVLSDCSLFSVSFQREHGPPGLMGSTGKPGLPGPQGAPGDSGPPGRVGDMGPRGFKGETASKGEKGEEGPAGDEGPEGEQGEPGEKTETCANHSRDSFIPSAICLRNLVSTLPGSCLLQAPKENQVIPARLVH